MTNWRSSLSSQTLSGLALTKTSSWVRSQVRMVWAMAISTFVSADAGDLDGCFGGEGGASVNRGAAVGCGRCKIEDRHR